MSDLICSTAYFLVLMLTAVIVAGRRVLIGPVLGTAILLVQKSYFSLGAYGDKLVLGAVLIIVLCVFPRGLASIRPPRAWSEMAVEANRRAAR